jgi:hypothetical protein
MLFTISDSTYTRKPSVSASRRRPAEEGVVAAQPPALQEWAVTRPHPWRGGLEATLFSGWIYDTLQPYSAQLEMAHPAKMKAISAGKRERHPRRPQHCRPGALQSSAGLLCGNAADSRTAPLLRYRSLVVSEAVRMKRNRWLQTTLIEAAKLAPRWNPQLAALHARELERGHRNRATLAVARKLVAYLLAVDKSGQSFQLRAQLSENGVEKEQTQKIKTA